MEGFEVVEVVERINVLESQLAEKDAEIARLREAIKNLGLCYVEEYDLVWFHPPPDYTGCGYKGNKDAYKDNLRVKSAINMLYEALNPQGDKPEAQAT